MQVQTHPATVKGRTEQFLMQQQILETRAQYFKEDLPDPTNQLSQQQTPGSNNYCIQNQPPVDSSYQLNDLILQSGASNDSITNAIVQSHNYLQFEDIGPAPQQQAQQQAHTDDDIQLATTQPDFVLPNPPAAEPEDDDHYDHLVDYFLKK